MRVFKITWIILFYALSSIAGEPRVGDRNALVIIDMQPSFVSRGGNHKIPSNVKKLKEILENQKKMIRFAKERKMPIVFIEFKDQGDTYSELKLAAKGYKSVKYFHKTTDGMFDDANEGLKNLSDYLRNEMVGTLIITGANGGACVEASIYGALHYNYNVTAYNEGIADFNYKDFIFPYVNEYDFQPTCKSCTFQEIRNYSTLLLKFSMNIPLDKSKTQDVKINNSPRETNKDIPISVPVSEKIETQSETKAQ